MAEIVRLPTSAQPPGSDPYLKSGGGDGTFDGMEQRIKRLEDDMKEARADLKVIRSDLSELKGKVGMLPGYPGIALIMGVLLAVATFAQKFIPTVAP